MSLLLWALNEMGRNVVRRCNLFAASLASSLLNVVHVVTRHQIIDDFSRTRIKRKIKPRGMLILTKLTMSNIPSLEKLGNKKSIFLILR